MTMKPKAERYRLKPAVQPTQTRQPQTTQPPEATSAPTGDTYTARQLRRPDALLIDTGLTLKQIWMQSQF